MKIYAFDVRDDERQYFEQLKKEKGLDIQLRTDSLTMDTIPFLEENSAVTILGMEKYGEAEMKALAAKKIYYLSTRTIGYDHIDLEAAKKYGIHVANAAYGPESVADYTIMMILLCLRPYKQALWRMQVNDFSLGGLIGREIHDLTIGVIGTGRIGSTVIRELSGFGCKIIAYDKYPKEEVKKYAAYVDTLDELYKEADVITIHTVLNDSTYHMIDGNAIAKMKDGVVLVNCARGPLMDMSALIAGIESEKIGALGLDTVENEQSYVHQNRKTDIFSDRDIAYLKQFKNAIYTQHMAFYTEEAVRSMVEASVLSLVDMNQGKETRLQLV